jgi:hypothetical protein
MRNGLRKADRRSGASAIWRSLDFSGNTAKRIPLGGSWRIVLISGFPAALAFAFLGGFARRPATGPGTGLWTSVGSVVARKAYRTLVHRPVGVRTPNASSPRASSRLEACTQRVVAAVRSESAAGTYRMGTLFIRGCFRWAPDPEPREPPPPPPPRGGPASGWGG